MVYLNVNNTQNPYLVTDFMGGVICCKSIKYNNHIKSQSQDRKSCDWDFLLGKIIAPVISQ